MTRIYVVRHCEAKGNVERLFQGSSDFDISETGAKQLTYLTKRFAETALDYVYTSPLLRAKKTALAVIGDRDLIPEEVDGLRELNGGILEGRPFAEGFERIPGLAEIWDLHPEDFAPEGGEPMREAYERIWEAVRGIAAKNVGKTVACASHGGAIRCLMCRLLYGDITRLKDTAWSENTAVTLLEWEDGALFPRVVFWNDTSHLPEGLLPKRSRLSKFIGGAKT